VLRLARINVFFQTALQYGNNKLFVVDLYIYVFIKHNNVFVNVCYSNIEYFNNIRRLTDDNFLIYPYQVIANDSAIVEYNRL